MQSRVKYSAYFATVASGAKHLFKGSSANAEAHFATLNTALTRSNSQRTEDDEDSPEMAKAVNQAKIQEAEQPRDGEVDQPLDDIPSSGDEAEIMDDDGFKPAQRGGHLTNHTYLSTNVNRMRYAGLGEGAN